MSEYHPLTEDEAWGILEKGTEPPFTGMYTDHFDSGYYGCKQCHAMLARASDAEAVRGAAAMAEQGWAMPARPRGPWSMWQTWMHQPSQAMRGTV